MSAKIEILKVVKMTICGGVHDVEVMLPGTAIQIDDLDDKIVYTFTCGKYGIEVKKQKLIRR